MKVRLAACAAFVLVLRAGVGRSAEPWGPPTLPRLAHTDVETALETTAGGAPGGTLYWHRLHVELPLSSEAYWFLGAALAGGGAQMAGAPGSLQLANAEMRARGVWVATDGLAFGGGLALVPPTGAAREGAMDPARLVVSLRPWDRPHVMDGVWTLRPFFDIRAVFGTVSVQVRHSVDLGIDGRTGRNAVAALLGASITHGVRHVAWGMEGWELYLIDSPLPDGTRTFLSLSPFVCGDLGRVRPCASVLVSPSARVGGQDGLAEVLALGGRVNVALAW